MKEIEVKILEIDKKEIISTLERLGATLKFKGELKASYMDNGTEMRDSKRLLRVREGNKKTVVTVKRVVEDKGVRVNDEYEVEVSDFETAKELFETLGYKEYARICKERVSYKLKESSVEIDTHENVPPFIEIESPTKEELKEIIEMLGYRMEDSVDLNGKEVLEYYGK